MSRSLAGTPLPPIPSEEVERKCRRGTLRFSFSLLPAHSAAKSLWLRLTREREISIIEGSALGELFHTFERVGRVLRPRSLAGGDVWGWECGRFGVSGQLLIQAEGVACTPGAAELWVTLRDCTSLHCPPLPGAERT